MIMDIWAGSVGDEKGYRVIEEGIREERVLQLFSVILSQGPLWPTVAKRRSLSGAEDLPRVGYLHSSLLE
jgi:hypothetical protein